MSSIWILPAVLAGIGLVAALAMGFRAAEELSALRRQLRQLAALRPALVEIRSAGITLRNALQKPRRP
jgi:hypothetical protein